MSEVRCLALAYVRIYLWVQDEPAMIAGKQLCLVFVANA